MDAAEKYELEARDDLNKTFVKQILVFLSVAVFAVIGLANLESTAVLWAIASFESLFHALIFWFLAQRYTIDEEVEFAEHRRLSSGQRDEEAGKSYELYGRLHELRKLVEWFVIFFVVLAYLFLLSSLIDQYTTFVMFQIFAVELPGMLLIGYAVIAIILWLGFYSLLSRNGKWAGQGS